MDPTVVLKLVREQRRQINDKFNPHQKLSPSHMSPNSLSSGTFFRFPAQAYEPNYSNHYNQNFNQVVSDNMSNHSSNLLACYQDKIGYKPDRIYSNNSKFSDINGNFAPQSNKIPFQYNYFNNQKINDSSFIKKIDSERKFIKHHIPSNISYFTKCNCKECNEIDTQKLYANEKQQSNSNQEIGAQPYCDCPSCNLALCYQKNDTLISSVSPIPTNKFVISQNSSFTRIVPASKKYHTALEPNNNFLVRDQIEKKIYENKKMNHQMKRCSCAECIQGIKNCADKNGNQKLNNIKTTIDDKNSSLIFKTKKDKNIYDQQTTGLVMPVVLASSLSDFQNITREKNNFLAEKMTKRKLNGSIENQIMCKKNRVLSYEKLNYQLDNSKGINRMGKNEIELGEVVNLSMERPKSCNLPSNKVFIEDLDRNWESAVIVSKKMMPMVAKRMNDWLEKSVEFIYNFSIRSGLDMGKLFSILSDSWFKLILIYMVENNLDFFVTRDNHETSKNSTDSPKEKDASELINLISKCHFDLNLETEGYELLREMVLLNENSTEPTFSECLQDTELKLEENLKKTNVYPYENLAFLLSSIQNIKRGLIKNLFYRNVPVQDILNKKLISLTSEKEIIS